MIPKLVNIVAVKYNENLIILRAFDCYVILAGDWQNLTLTEQYAGYCKNWDYDSKSLPVL